MADAARHESAHRRPHAPAMAGPFLEFDLTTEVAQLHREATWHTGQNARTLVKYDDFRVILTALQANTCEPEHEADGRMSLHVLSGHIRLKASGRTFDLLPGSLLALDHGTSHELLAIEESAFLLTMTWSGSGGAHIGKEREG